MLFGGVLSCAAGAPKPGGGAFPTCLGASAPAAHSMYVSMLLLPIDQLTTVCAPCHFEQTETEHIQISGQYSCIAVRHNRQACGDPDKTGGLNQVQWQTQRLNSNEG